MKNCDKCNSSYEPYKIGEDSEKYSGWCQIPVGREIDGVYVIDEPKGVCGFCNPKSIWYNG